VILFTPPPSLGITRSFQVQQPLFFFASFCKSRRHYSQKNPCEDMTFGRRKQVVCLAAYLSEEERAKGTIILVINSGSFWRKIAESGEDLNLLFPLRCVLLSFINSISSSYLRLGQCTPCNLLRMYVICRSELQYHCNPKQKRQNVFIFLF
jgi:hypothetical protein